MGRVIGSAILGYAVILVSIFVTFSVAHLLMGPDRTYQAGSYEVTGFWILVTIILSLGAAVAGGLACIAIDRGGSGLKVLIGMVVVLGIVSAVPAYLTEPGETVRGASVGVWESIQNAQQPFWVAVANPLAGVLGLLLAARLASGRSR